VSLAKARIGDNVKAGEHGLAIARLELN